MYPVHVTLALDADKAQPERVTADVLTDLFWAHATPGDRLEHVHARMEFGLIHITLFMRAPSPAHAEAAARLLCQRILAVQLMSGWSCRD
jgi:hypothetical protein